MPPAWERESLELGRETRLSGSGTHSTGGGETLGSN